MKVLEPEPAKVKRALQSLVAELRARSEVRAVWLIGSYHRNDFGPFSDVDLVLVVAHSEERFVDRPARFRSGVFPVSIDLFVYTLQEVAEMRQSRHPFWKHIEENHTALFQAPDFR
ncbi:MAG: nucleotidyltransferase domain-containing protein [Acidobacteria bacterium]|nr:nucleotidyltransferase domain-containing protein [Acidobacteriota bacterium]